jgi:hypothetical protein
MHRYRHDLEEQHRSNIHVDQRGGECQGELADQGGRGFRLAGPGAFAGQVEAGQHRQPDLAGAERQPDQDGRGDKAVPVAELVPGRGAALMLPPSARTGGTPNRRRPSAGPRRTAQAARPAARRPGRAGQAPSGHGRRLVCRSCGHRCCRQPPSSMPATVWRASRPASPATSPQKRDKPRPGETQPQLVQPGTTARQAGSAQEASAGSSACGGCSTADASASRPPDHPPKPRKSGVSRAGDRRRLIRLLVPGLATPPRTRSQTSRPRPAAAPAIRPGPSGCLPGSGGTPHGRGQGR